MITTVSDFLIKLKDKEEELCEKYDIIGHPGMIGSMYEGLTKSILDKSIFAGLDLHVRAGKIKNSKDEFSGEIDCMLVIGEGENIPHTDKYIYDSSRVIAVIEVKKNLYSKDIKESYENLRTVLDVTEEREGESYHGNLLRGAWRLTCNEELPPRQKLASLPIEKQMLYHVLLLEAFYPARIVWGYNGFKSEYSLRESFVKYLNDNISISEAEKIGGFGPLNFPNLIICDQYSLMKNNGIPFALPLKEDGWWPFYVSSFENPVYFLLEIIWTRLQYMFELSPEIFGEDLTVNAIHMFLLAKFKKTDKMKGWEYKFVPTTKELLKKPLEHKEWEPIFLDKAQFIILNLLCKAETIDIKNDKKLGEFLINEGYALDSFTASLKATGLVDITDQVISLITEKCVCGITPDGRYYAADDKTGHVTRWTMKMLKGKDL
jgi:hypothetical protein